LFKKRKRLNNETSKEFLDPLRCSRLVVGLEGVAGPPPPPPHV